MTYLVTGANGFIGSRLCHALAAAGTDVVGLCRTGPDNQWLNHPRIRIAIGDIMDQNSIAAAIEGCEFCFHLAGLAIQWARNRDEFFRINVAGTTNVLEASKKCGVSKLVYTSTAGVLGPSAGSHPIDETRVPAKPPGTDYERSKVQAENVVREAADNGLQVCIVNPTRVFGPGPLTPANSLTRIMAQIAQGSWNWIPGDGSSVGNYVFVDDVVNGHLLAMEKGVAGRRYVLGGDNLTFNELFQLILQYSGRTRPLAHMPRTALMAWSWLQLGRAKCLGIPPSITPAFARRYFAIYPVSSDRAIRELGYAPHSVGDGVRLTMQWLEKQDRGSGSPPARG